MEKNINISIKDIALYWSEKGIPISIPVEYEDLDKCCWNCGEEKNKRIQRCHIVPKSLGGSNTADNFVLLCDYCHNLAPNINDDNQMWKWIEMNNSIYKYTSLFGFKVSVAICDFEKINNVDFIKFLTDLITHKYIKSADELFNYNKISTHRYYITPSTYTALLNLTLSDFVNFKMKFHNNRFLKVI
jgi:hypothetical protein